jgi:hypothetical protein
MRLQILSNCRADGRHLAIGEVAELPQGAANELLALGLAAIAPEPDPEPAPSCPPKVRRGKTSIPTTTTPEE